MDVSVTSKSPVETRRVACFLVLKKRCAMYQNWRQIVKMMMPISSGGHNL